VNFWARPQALPDGSSNMFKWKAGIPGKEGTDWAGGVYTVSMDFTEEYPARPPKCTFKKRRKFDQPRFCHFFSSLTRYFLLRVAVPLL
jgi:ubiquitin-conjugating enzyme E2 I